MWSCGGGRLAGQVEQDEALDHREPHLVQREAGRVEVRQAFRERRVAQRAVEAVRPRVVRALQTAQPALGLGDELRAAVPAGVQERAREAVLVADDDDAFSTGLDLEESSSFRHLLDVPGADPAASEEVGPLPLQDGGIGEGLAGQLGGALERQQRALEFVGVERQGGVRTASNGPVWSEFGHFTASLDAAGRLCFPSNVHPCKADMSPLLTARPSVSVTLRLLGACVVMAVVAAFVPLAGGDGESSAAVPACLTLGIVCAALVSHMFYASARGTGDERLAWLSVGTTLAMIGLIMTLVALPSLFPNGGPVRQTDDANAARYLIWHALLAGSGIIALAGVTPSLRNLLIFGGLGALLLTWAAVAPSPLGDLASSDGFSPIMRAAVGGIVLVSGARRVRLVPPRRGRRSRWGDMCVLALLSLSALDAFAYMWASQLFEGSWWASLALRAGQFAIPAVGLLIGFIAVAEKLREFEDELTANLDRRARACPCPRGARDPGRRAPPSAWRTGCSA